MRHHPPHTGKLHTPAKETPAGRRASGGTRTGPHAAQPGQERRGTEQTTVYTQHPQTQPNRGRQRPNPYPGRNRKPEPTKAVQARQPYPPTHQQIHIPQPNTRAANSNQRRQDKGANRTNRHNPRAPGRNAGRQENTQTRARAKSDPQKRKNQRRTSLNPQHTRYTTVGNSVSKVPDTEAARARQVTRPNEIQSPGVRMHHKASAALGLEAECATPKHLEHWYQECAACMPCQRDTPRSRVNL